MNRNTIPRVLMIGTAVLFAAACSASASPTAVPPMSTPAATATPPRTPTPPPVPTPTPTAAPERTNVSGIMDGGVVREDEAGRLFFEFTYTMSDPRVSGTEEADCGEKFFDAPPDLGGGAGVWWDCEMLLTTPGGTWKGVAGVGSEFMHLNDLRVNGTWIYEGQGAYEGLRYLAMFSGSPETDRIYLRQGYVIAGWIEPAE